MVTGDWRERERVAEKAVLGGTAGGTSLLILAAIIHLALIRPSGGARGRTRTELLSGGLSVVPPPSLQLQTGQSEICIEGAAAQQPACLPKAFSLLPSFLLRVPAHLCACASGGSPRKHISPSVLYLFVSFALCFQDRSKLLHILKGFALP